VANDTGRVVLPAVCPNGHQFDAQRTAGINFAPGNTHVLIGTKTRCPYCGAVATIVSGEYTLEQRANEVVTALRSLSRDQIWELQRVVQQARRDPTDEKVQAAIDALPDRIRQVVEEVVRRENKPGVRWSILGVILAILLAAFPPQEIEAKDAHLVETPPVTQLAPEQPTPSELEQAIQNAIHQYKNELEASQGQAAEREWGKVGRNHPCPCGSGDKFKFCHGKAPAPHRS
jgi:hypothetical protein